MGTFLTPMLAAPVIAPALGGAIGEALGWRYNFLSVSLSSLPHFLNLFLRSCYSNKHPAINIGLDI